MTKLNQIVAIDKGVKTNTGRDIDKLYHLIEKTALLNGISRTYRPKDDDGDQLPPESTLVQVKLPAVLEDLAKHFTRLFDVVLTKETGNMSAEADLVVDGATLAAGLSVPFLLFLEKQLVDFQTTVRNMPTLDPAFDWSYDPNRGVYATEPTGSTRTQKVPRSFTKAPATDKHPAQVEMFTEDVIVGTWDTIRFSGAIPADRRIQITERLTALIEATKFAREQANQLEVTNQKIGEALFTYLLAD